MPELTNSAYSKYQLLFKHFIISSVSCECKKESNDFFKIVFTMCSKRQLATVVHIYLCDRITIKDRKQL